MSVFPPSTSPSHRGINFFSGVRIARNLMHKRLQRMKHGALTLQDSTGTQKYGQVPGPNVVVTIHNDRFYTKALYRGNIGVAEAYADGDWDCGDLVSLFRLFIINATLLPRLDSGLARLYRLIQHIRHRLRKNTLVGSQENIAKHYDLGENFYRQFLDTTMAYSCAFFSEPSQELVSAQVAKYDRICQKLDLQPSDHLLEIGCGWGGFALHAARHYGCRVTATTISKNQFQYTQHIIKQAAISDRVTILDRDYRQLTGQFHKLASIEMIEAVGHENLTSFFASCSRLLVPNGRMFLQAIALADREYPGYLRSIDFIRHSIFPGGCLVSLGSLNTAIAKSSDFNWTQLEDLSPHYAETLRRWRIRFFEAIPLLNEQSHTPHFLRLWEYYLAYCEAGFGERRLGLFQIILDKPDCRRTLGTSLIN